jgi:hypothetical protein
MSNTDLITTKGDLKKIEVITYIKSFVKDKLSSNLDLTKVKSALDEFIKVIMRYVKVILKEKKLTLSVDEMRTLALEIIQSMLTLTSPEIETIKSMINLVLNNNLAKDISKLKRVKKLIGSILKKVL